MDARALSVESSLLSPCYASWREKTRGKHGKADLKGLYHPDGRFRVRVHDAEVPEIENKDGVVDVCRAEISTRT